MKKAAVPPYAEIAKPLRKTRTTPLLSAFAAAAILSAYGAAAADTIYLKKGDTLENVTITEITQTDVKYKVGERTVVYSISKSDVSKIAYNDGAEDVFEGGERTERQSGADGETGGSYREGGQGDGGGYSSGRTDEENSAAYMVARVDWRKKSIIQKVRNDELNSDDTVLIMRDRKIVHFDTTGVHRFNQLLKRNIYNYRVSAGYSAIGFNTFGTIFTMNRDRRFSGETLRSDRYVMAGLGIGVVEKGLFAISFGGGLTLCELNNLDILFGFAGRFSLHGEEIVGNIEFLYKQWLFSTGTSAFLSWKEGTLSFAPSLNAAYFIKEIKKSELIIETIKHKKQGSDKPRYFRPGIDFNYHVYNSEIESFKDMDYEKYMGGLGLFFRIGPDNLYFTTGCYAKVDYTALHEARSLSMFGLSLGTLPLLDVEWAGLLVEIPALLNFGAGQIRFSGGALFDFYASNEVSVTVLGSSSLSYAVEDRIYERFEDEFPGGHMYWAVGLDFDILKYWGIGAKFLILGDTYGGKNVSQGFEPSPYQVRVSTYFVF